MINAYDDFLCLEYTPQYYCGNAVYGMEASNLNDQYLDIPAQMQMYQHFAFVMVYSAGSISSYNEFQRKFEKVMAVIVAGGVISHVSVVVIETQCTETGTPYGSAVRGVPPFVREVPEGVGRAFVEDKGKGCAFAEIRWIESKELREVFGAVVEIAHEACKIHREEIGWLEKLRVFERGLGILREERASPDKLEVP